MKSLVDCHKIYVKDAGKDKGVGVYASEDISEGDIIEYGLVRKVYDANFKNAYCF